MIKEDNDFLNDNFFVIDSNNCDEINSKFYGYAIYDGKIVIQGQNKHISELLDEDTYGTYVNIIKNDDCLIIQQDYFGGYGLFIYERDDYFAISNSLLYLCNSLKRNHTLSIDKDYARAYFCCSLVPLSFQKTIFKEIYQLPQCYNIYINTRTKHLKLSRKNDTALKLDISSKEAMHLLDKWHSKWNNLVNVLSERYPLSADLSGGFDSRVSFSVLFKSKIDFNKIKISSIDDDLHTHKEDYEIASAIANRINVKLNQNLNSIKTKRISPELAYNISMLTKGTFHKQIFWKNSYNVVPRFVLTGSGGESLRDYWNIDINQFMTNELNRGCFERTNFSNSIHRIINESIECINKYYIDNKMPLTQKIYNYIRQRNHFCKSIVENFLSNTITLAPLMDPMLYQIEQISEHNDDRNLLFSIIYDRYIPEFNDIAFEGGRKIDVATKNIASKINSEYPYDDDKNHHVFYCDISNRISPAESNLNLNLNQKCVDEFKKDYFKQFVEKQFSIDTYINAEKMLNNAKFMPLEKVNALVVMYLCQSISMASKINNSDDLFSLLGEEKDEDVSNIYWNNGIINKIFNTLSTSRIDIINRGRDSRIKFNSNNQEVFCSSPKWLFDKECKTQGCSINTSKLEFDFDIEVKGDGNTVFYFLAPDIRDKNNSNSRLKVMIDYTKIRITNLDNGQIIYNSENLLPLWHDERLKLEFSKDIKRFRVSIASKAHSYAYDELMSIINNFF